MKLLSKWTWADEESVSSSKKAASFSAKSAKSAAKLMVGLEDISSFGSNTFKRLIAETTLEDEDDDQTLSEASKSSKATTVTLKPTPGLHR